MAPFSTQVEGQRRSALLGPLGNGKGNPRHGLTWRARASTWVAGANSTPGPALLARLIRGRPGEEQLYLRHNGPEHVMAFAPTRSGKGVGLILPTLLAWEGSSIVLDIKGENWALTAGWRKSQNQVVLRFDWSDPSGASAAFNPLEEIRLDMLLAIPDVQNMAAMLVDPSGRGLEDHWSKAAFAMLGGVLLHCLHHGAAWPGTHGHAV